MLLYGLGGLRHTLNIFCPSPLGRGEGEAGGISSTTGARWRWRSRWHYIKRPRSDVHETGVCFNPWYCSVCSSIFPFWYSIVFNTTVLKDFWLNGFIVEILMRSRACTNNQSIIVNMPSCSDTSVNKHRPRSYQVPMRRSCHLISTSTACSFGVCLSDDIFFTCTIVPWVKTALCPATKQGEALVWFCSPCYGSMSTGPWWVLLKRGTWKTFLYVNSILCISVI